MIRLSPLGAVLMIALATPLSAASREQAVPLTWQSTSPVPEQLAREFADLYVSLYNSQNLKVRTVKLGERFIEPAVRAEKVFFGRTFPAAFDALLCDLNDGVCDRDLEPVDRNLLSDTTVHVGGYLPSTGRWRANPETMLVIPDYEFQTETSLARIPVPSNWVPKDFVASDGIDCTPWSMSCAELVSRFNPRIFGSKVSSTTATVPYLRYETTIGVEIAEPSAAQTALGDLFGNEAVMSGSNTVIHTLDPGVLSDSFKTLDAGRATADQFLDGIGANIKPIGKLKSYSSHAEGPLAPEVQGLFKLISYNYGPGNDLPDIYREPVAIGIIDTTIEKGHCDWPEVHFGSGAKLQVEEENECGAMSDGLLDRRDHVMLIGGIIAAKGRRNASVGMNPYADLVFMPIDPDGTDQNEAQFLIQTFMKPETISLEIVNLSSGLNRSEMVGSAEMLKFAIGALQDLVLVVTAAGNEGLDLSQDCIVVPACMNELDNVISVVGVNRDEDDPAIWRTQAAGSNTHPNFDIGAVAQDVYSTVSGNRYGKDSGTSFAVPQVSAAASLVLAAAKRAWSAELDGARILPKFIKDRLVYTADIKPGLNGRMRSGRLNVSRAIEVAHDQYVLFDGRVIIGQTLERPNWFKCQTPVADEADQLFWNLRRMTYQEDTGRHFLFKHRPDDQHIGDRNAPLTEFQSCLVTTRSPTVSVLTSPGTVVDFTFGDIKDFTSRMIEAL